MEQLHLSSYIPGPLDCRSALGWEHQSGASCTLRLLPCLTPGQRLNMAERLQKMKLLSREGMGWGREGTFQMAPQQLLFMASLNQPRHHTSKICSVPLGTA